MSTSQSVNLLLINGPNLNLLGTREPSVYGSQTLDDVHALAKQTAAKHGVSVMTYQSNHEGAIIDRIHQAREEGVKGILINPGECACMWEAMHLTEERLSMTGALTHTSVGLRDALLGVSIPFIEIHVSNPHSREPFRHHSYLSDKAIAVIAGLGVTGYGESSRMRYFCGGAGELIRHWL
jgi:3-dehydroquinate dehydratase-2